MKSGIYLITSIVNGKKYVGSSCCLAMRKSSHFRTLIKNKHNNSHLQRHFNKYGNDLEFSVLEYCEKDKLIEREQYYIDTLKPEFNICKIAGSNLGMKFSDEHKRKISESQKGEKAYWHGKHFPDEMRDKIRKANSGERNYQTSLTDELVSEIKKQINNFIPLIEIAKKYNVSRYVIGDIKRGKTWKHIMPNITNKPQQKLLKKHEIIGIIKMLNWKINQYRIAKLYNVSQSAVSMINTGNRHSCINKI